MPWCPGTPSLHPPVYSLASSPQSFSDRSPGVYVPVGAACLYSTFVVPQLPSPLGVSCVGPAPTRLISVKVALSEDCAQRMPAGR